MGKLDSNCIALFAQCTHCGGFGHHARQCPEFKRPTALRHARWGSSRCPRVSRNKRRRADPRRPAAATASDAPRCAPHDSLRFPPRPPQNAPGPSPRLPQNPPGGPPRSLPKQSGISSMQHQHENSHLSFRGGWPVRKFRPEKSVHYETNLLTNVCGKVSYKVFDLEGWLRLFARLGAVIWSANCPSGSKSTSRFPQN